MTYPKLPTQLDGHSMTEDELAELWRKMCLELLNQQFLSRTHGNRRTYDAGCNGPICAKAVREHGRRRTQTRPNERYRYLDPIIEFWWPAAVERIEAAQMKMIEKLVG